MKNTFTESELILLSNAIILAIQNNNEAAKMTVSEKVTEEIGKSSAALGRLNGKICAMMGDDKAQNDAPNILIRVTGGMVQGVSCNIPGATCWVLDDDALEAEDDEDEDAEDEDAEDRADEQIEEFERLCSSPGYDGIY